MNKKALLLLSFVLFSTVIGMDPRIKAKIARYEREIAALIKAEKEKKRQDEQAQALKNKEESDSDIILNNGKRVSLSFFLSESVEL